MKFICSWCEKEVKKETHDKSIEISHVICEPCKSIIIKEIKGYSK